MTEPTQGGRDDVPPELVSGLRRTFRGASMREALAKVKAVIGPHALILSTKDLGRDAAVEDRRFEVIASYPQAGAPRDRVEAPVGLRRDRPRTATFGQQPPPARPRTHADRSTTRPNGPGDDALQGRLEHLEGALATLNGQLASLVSVNESLRDELTRMGVQINPIAAMVDDGPPDVHLRTVAPLVEAGLAPELADRIVARALKRAAPRRGVALAEPPDIAAELERSVRVTTPLWRLPAGAVCAFVGPTGGGKTTTLLKVLALARYRHGRTVACVSTDVHRVGAFRALEGYADVMGFQLAGAHDRLELELALEELADVDLVLVDTPGHNPFDDQARARILDVVSGREVDHHLVLPATLDGKLMPEVVGRYAGPALSSLIVSKVDEARSAAPVLAACLAADVPVSHVCHGQEVPGDIEAADKKRIAEEILARAS